MIEPRGKLPLPKKVKFLIDVTSAKHRLLEQRHNFVVHCSSVWVDVRKTPGRVDFPQPLCCDLREVPGKHFATIPSVVDHVHLAGATLPDPFKSQKLTGHRSSDLLVPSTLTPTEG